MPLEGEVAEAQQVTHAVNPVDRKEQAGIPLGEQRREAQIERRPREREGLRQLAGEYRYRTSVSTVSVPNLDLRPRHVHMISGVFPDGKHGSAGRHLITPADRDRGPDS